MQMLTDIFVTILSTYLAFTNALADVVATYMPTNTPAQEVTVSEHLTRLPSRFSLPDVIPSVLIENAAYQQAAVTGALGEQTTASSPMNEALVNIYCTYTTDEYIRTTTGTGFFINDDGVILTNAHVAQFLLLEDAIGAGDSECVIRTGNPAAARYKAELLYISPAWIREHAALINDAAPKGTGERDYALLFLVSGMDNEPLPGHTPQLAIDTEPLSRTAKRATVEIGGYPTVIEAETFTVEQATDVSTIAELYTFGDNTADIFALTGSAVGEHGISGGPVLSEASKVIGLIVTKSDDSVLGEGSLNAITLSYIDRTMIEDTGLGIRETSSGNLMLRAKLFKQLIVPFLRQELLEVLE